MSKNGNGSKLKIAKYWAASCGGCDISLLEIGPHLLDLIKVADIVFWPCAADFKYKDVAAYEDGYIDICFYNGAVRTSEQEEIARLLRKKSKTLIAYGECAVDGGIPALANLNTKEEIFHAAYLENPSLDNPNGVTPQPITECEFGELEIPWFYPQVLRLKDIVDVDYEIPGCPPQADRVWEAVQALAGGELPARNDAVKVACRDKSVCDECPLEKKLIKIKEFKRPHEIRPEPDWCLLEQGIICMGPATRSGCDARCTSAGMPCRGCYGPSGDVIDQGTAMVSAIGSLLDATDEPRAQELIRQIVDPVGSFYRFSMSSSMMKARK
ncbi:MAG: oxidoreductase [Acidobacteria bacterium]|nr:oxidoreductase [Acidobacteriota bacterium]